MANPFQTVILKLKDMGAFEFLFPFMLTSAIFYGLLRKSRVFGEPENNISVNAIVALVAAFMVWAAPVITGISIEKPLSTFFMQGISATLVIMVGVMIVSMFFGPDLPKQLQDRFGGQGFWLMIFGGALLIGVGVLVSSGLIDIFFPGGFSTWISSETAGMVVVAIAFIVTVWLVIGTGSKETEEKKGEK